jgi:hypothetical protein
MDFALQLPVNKLSFGQVSVCILQEIYKKGLEPSLFPINHDIEAYSLPPDFIKWLQSSIRKGPRFHKRDHPVFMLWHLNASTLNCVSNNRHLLSFYELDAPTKAEVNIASSVDKLYFSSNHSIDTFSNYGINSSFMPLGFDHTHFKKLDKKYFDDGRIVFNLCGKLEKRKRHSKVIKSWAKRFGNDKKYELQCAIHNSFIAKDMPALIGRILEGKRYFNIQFLNYMDKNIQYNDFLNSGNIIIGMSGGEGWGLPEFHSVAIGKHAVIMEETGYKEWANRENSVMVSSSGKIPSADGVFFNEGADFNQGRIYDFDEDEFIAACEKAIERVESNEENLNGLKLQEEFTYEKVTNQILESLHA